MVWYGMLKKKSVLTTAATTGMRCECEPGPVSFIHQTVYVYLGFCFHSIPPLLLIHPTP